MPSTLTYPGVYVEEVPSGVRTIVGVATSIAAFLGRTERGTPNEATTVTSQADFDRTFGPPGANAPVAFAVRDFFLNGGTQAVVVRLMAAGGVKATAAAGGVTVTASSEGEWGNEIEVVLTGGDGAPASKLFDLTVQRKNPAEPTRPTVLESFTTLSVEPGSRRLADKVVNAGSLYVRVELADGATVPAPVPAGQPAPPPLPLVGGLGGGPLGVGPAARPAYQAGLDRLEKTDLFNLLCIPPDERDKDTDPTVYQDAVAFCERRRAFLIVDPPAVWHNTERGTLGADLKRDPRGEKGKLGLNGTVAQYAAVFFPRVMQPNPDDENREAPFAPCGVIAGLFARTDTNRGVWKAPAGLEATLLGIRRLAVKLPDEDNGLLNPVGINCLRSFPAAGNVCWGARTLAGDDQTPNDYKYVPVRRLALFLEESLYRGTQWAVFEPNAEPLWAQLRLAVGDFLHGLYRQGAFAGASSATAYRVTCDATTTTPGDVDRGIVNVLVAFAPLKPAEFVVLRVQQLARPAAGG